MSYAPIPKGGMVETTYAKIWARYGYWSPTYLRMLRGAAVPRHVAVMGENFRRTRYWEQPDKPKPAAKPKGWDWLDAPKAIPSPGPEESNGSWWDQIVPVPLPESKPSKEGDDWWAEIEAKAKEILGK